MGWWRRRRKNDPPQPGVADNFRSVDISEIRAELRARDASRPVVESRLVHPSSLLRTIAIRVRATVAPLAPVARTRATELRRIAPLAISRAANTIMHAGRSTTGRARSLRLRAPRSPQRTAVPTPTATASAKLGPKPAPLQNASDRNGHDLELALLRLAARESARGFNHPDVASELHLVGALHHEAGRYNEALAFYSTALVIRQRTLGRDHPEVASTLVDLEAARRDEADEEKRADMASRRTDPERAEVGA
ncbi:MAG: tetratricopeptide repeat protein [Candidatus Limnocylindria bacterium]